MQSCHFKELKLKFMQAKLQWSETFFNVGDNLNVVTRLWNEFSALALEIMHIWQCQSRFILSFFLFFSISVMLIKISSFSFSQERFFVFELKKFFVQLCLMNFMELASHSDVAVCWLGLFKINKNYSEEKNETTPHLQSLSRESYEKVFEY